MSPLCLTRKHLGDWLCPFEQNHVRAVERVQRLRVELAGLTAKKLLQHRLLSAGRLHDDDAATAL
jgi:hypothetical protein